MAVNVWYHVGSKNEMPGRTGFAHLFEHVMFTGSGHVPYGLHDKLTEGVGGIQQRHDRRTIGPPTTRPVPSNYVESALWLEADRMGFLLDTLDLAKLNAQRDIVKNERRQSLDNQPYGRAGEMLSQATYPASHPYSWDVIGSMDDLSAASEADVKNFFRLYYAPNNAFLAIVGDFDPVQTKAWVSKYFGGIPHGAAITRPQVAPVTLSDVKRLVYEDQVQVPRLYVQWPTVGEKNDDEYALDVLAGILSGPRTARLTKALVYDQQAAGECIGEPELERGRRRVPGGHHAAARSLADRSRSCGRHGHRQDQGGGADGRRDSEGGRWPGARLRARARVELEQGDDALRRRRLPRRSGAVQDRVPEVRWRSRQPTSSASPTPT